MDHSPAELPDAENRRGEEFRLDLRAGQGERFRGLDGETLRRLNTLDDAKSWSSIAATLGLFIAIIGLSLYFWSASLWFILWLVPAFIIIATRQQACFVLAHDAAHYRLFRARWLNDLVGCALAAPVGISMHTYRVVHRLHHNHLYEIQDPDTPLHGGYPRGRAYLIKKLLRDLAGLTAHKTYAYFFGAPAINDELGQPGQAVLNRPLNDTSPELRRAARRDRWLVVAFHVAAPVIAWHFGYLLQYLILWVLPLVTVLQAILRFRAILEHGAVSDFTSPLHSARTNLGPRLLIGMLFPHYVNYHIEHHLYPAVPHYNLPACHAALRERGLLEGAEVRDVFATAQMVLAERAQKPA